jgi:flagellar hook-associated protein 1 FlgK
MAVLAGTTPWTIRKWLRRHKLQKPMGSWSIGKAPPNKGRSKENYEPLRRTSAWARRTSLVKQLSEIVEVKELESHGDYQLVTKNNRLLVLNAFVQPLAVADVTSSIGSGSLVSNLAVRDTYVPKYVAALDQLAYEVVQKVNTIHAAAYNLDGGTGLNFFGTLASATGASRLIALSSDVSTSARKIAASTLSTGNDNQAAVQMANLLHDSVFTGGMVTDQYQSLIFGIGTDLANADASLREHDALAAQLHNRRQSMSGVSIDEETVQILQFQRAYEASARLIRTVDELLQVALGIGAERMSGCECKPGRAQQVFK